MLLKVGVSLQLDKVMQPKNLMLKVVKFKKDIMKKWDWMKMVELKMELWQM